MRIRIYQLFVVLAFSPVLAAEDFGRGFELEFVTDKHESRCELQIAVTNEAKGTASLRCPKLDWKASDLHGSMTLTQQQVGDLRLLLRMSTLFSGQFWGGEARGLHFPLETLLVNAERTAVVVTSFNDSFASGSRKSLLAFLRTIEDSLRQAARGAVPDPGSDRPASR